jgi:hypothetical protein
MPTNYWIIEHPTRGVYDGFDTRAAGWMPSWKRDARRSEGLTFGSCEEAFRHLEQVNKHLRAATPAYVTRMPGGVREVEPQPEIAAIRRSLMSHTLSIYVELKDRDDFIPVTERAEAIAKARGGKLTSAGTALGEPMIRDMDFEFRTLRKALEAGRAMRPAFNEALVKVELDEAPLWGAPAAMTTTFRVDAAARTVHIVRRTDRPDQGAENDILVDVVLLEKELEALQSALKRSNKSGRVEIASVTL